MLALEQADRLVERERDRRPVVDLERRVGHARRDGDRAEVVERLGELLSHVFLVGFVEGRELGDEGRFERGRGLLPALEGELGVAPHAEDLRARVERLGLIEEAESLLELTGFVGGEGLAGRLPRDLDLFRRLRGRGRGEGERGSETEAREERGPTS